ncbi:hypothetical protein OG21DRAFT_1492052 [Imleria badia]|nr:hypothetical protein OG21DRAFT_1492052 [Imleria badia]
MLLACRVFMYTLLSMPPSVSSIKTVTEIPPDRISHWKEDLDKADTEPIQFPEGGTTAWCMVIGG